MSKSNRLQNIEEENAEEWPPVSCPQPETPTESMEFLARSWSVSAVELSKALCNTHNEEKPDRGLVKNNQPLVASGSPLESPRGSDETKELLLLHQALNPEFESHQHLLSNGPMYKSVVKRKTMGRRIKDHKERKKHEIRAHNAQLHAAVSVAGVAAAVAALAASPDKSNSSAKNKKKPSKKASAIASAAALVASHCIEMAEELGADRDHILAVVHSAINARTNGDVMALTAGAATALRGAATLRARLHRENGAAVALAEESGWSCKESSVSNLLNFVAKGGDLHWKQVSFNINSNWEVVVKMKSKHIGGTFTKKKKCIVSRVYSDVSSWPGREAEDAGYFAVQTEDRVIEFECGNKDKKIWIDGIQNMLHLHLV
ncbi:VAN3-binding protein isoform X2 [Salvia divinorum]|uniref:VAN3-binding protein isoform X2 n=1 Tax=Salvia divinorum TaxID=28513 RepID=A0ABD1FNM2_SALDI